MKAIFFTVALVTAAPAVAASNDADAICSMMGRIAEEVMRSRQNDVPLNVMIGNLSKVDAGYRDLARAMILGAYDSPAYLTDESKKHAIVEFSNTIQVQCYKSKTNK